MLQIQRLEEAVIEMMIQGHQLLQVHLVEDFNQSQPTMLKQKMKRLMIEAAAMAAMAAARLSAP
jgi:hypothetical protein